MRHSFLFFLSVLKNFGWLGSWLFLLIALTECIPFVGMIFPGGTLVSVGGFLAAQGYFNIWSIVVFATIGAIIGDYLGYLLGRWGRPWLEKKGFIKADWIRRGEDFFQKYGNTSVLWGRFIGPLRAVVPFTAGAARMKQRAFIPWNIAGAVGWAFFNAGLGYFSGNIISVVIRRWSHRLGWVLLLLIALGLLYWLIRKHGQSLWLNFKKQSQLFTEKLLAGRWYAILDERYPVISELTRTHAEEEKIYGYFLIVVVLLFLYVLALML